MNDSYETGCDFSLENLVNWTSFVSVYGTEIIENKS